MDTTQYARVSPRLSKQSQSKPKKLLISLITSQEKPDYRQSKLLKTHRAVAAKALLYRGK